MQGKTLRMHRVLSLRDGRSVMVAIDHGGIAGPMPGIERPAELVRACAEAGADAILATKGVLRAAAGVWPAGLGLALRLTGGFTVLGGGFEEEMIGTPRNALACAADCVAATVKFGHHREGAFIRQASLMAAESEELGLPVMIEAMAKSEGKKPNDPEGIRLAARAAQEIGADIVKTYYTGDPESFRRVVEGCPAPILVLGGERTDSLERLFDDVYWSLQAGGAGVAIGRGVWSPQPGAVSVRAVVESLVGLVHEGWSVKQAVRHAGQSGT
jgi:DhnA family fructose-bisphosphate aldolase class Ia